MTREWMNQVNRDIRVLFQRTGTKRRAPVGGSGGGGSTWIEKASVPELPDPATITNKTTMARVTAGPQIGQIYKIGWDAIEEVWVWECVSETYEAATEGALETGGVIGKYALGRVGDIYYRRSLDGSAWEAQNKWG